MANIGTLAVSVVAQVGKYVSGMRQAAAATAKFRQSAEREMGRASQMLAGLGKSAALAGMAALVGAAYGVGRSVQKAAEDMDELGKQADRLGVGTEHLVALRHGAALAGVSAEELATSLQRLNMFAGLVERSNAGAAQTLARLGVNARDFARMNFGQRLGSLAAGLQGIESQAQRARLGMELFGKSGATLTAFLAQGPGALRSAAEEAERLGLTFSRMDAAKVEGMNDAISRMWSSLSGPANRIAASIAPTVERMANKLANMVGALSRSEGFRRVLDGALWSAKAIGHALFLIEGTWFRIRAALFGPSLKALGGELSKLVGTLDGANPVLARLYGWASVYVEGAKVLGERLGGIVARLAAKVNASLATVGLNFDGSNIAKAMDSVALYTAHGLGSVIDSLAEIGTLADSTWDMIVAGAGETMARVVSTMMSTGEKLRQSVGKLAIRVARQLVRTADTIPWPFGPSDRQVKDANKGLDLAQRALARLAKGTAKDVAFFDEQAATFQAMGVDAYNRFLAGWDRAGAGQTGERLFQAYQDAVAKFGAEGARQLERLNTQTVQLTETQRELLKLYHAPAGSWERTQGMRNWFLKKAMVEAAAERAKIPSLMAEEAAKRERNLRRMWGGKDWRNRPRTDLPAPPQQEESAPTVRAGVIENIREVTLAALSVSGAGVEERQLATMTRQEKLLKALVSQGQRGRVGVFA